MKRNNKYNIYIILISVVFVLTAFIYSCGANLFSVSDDVDIGKDIDREIQSLPGEYPILKDRPEITNYVSNMGNYIINSSPKIKYKGIFPYKFQVINDSIVNAFCTPGGFIYVYTGLMNFVDNEATLAGVIAHEIAHAENRHMTQRLTSYYGVSIIMNLVLGSNPGTLAEIMSNLFVGLGFLANSRADETEADDYSIRYLMSTKYYPGGIKYFFNKIIEKQKKEGNIPGGFDRLLSTHPLAQDRIENVYKNLKELKITTDTTKGLFTKEYQEFKKILQKN